jgi:hypothetical protein
VILIAKVEKVGRNELPEKLGWEPNRVWAVWRSLAEDRWGASLKAGLIKAMAESYGGNRPLETFLRLMQKTFLLAPAVWLRSHVRPNGRASAMKRPQVQRQNATKRRWHSSDV